MKQPDVIVLGAGHNGLVAAGLLAKAGVSVTIYERRAELGGLAGTIDSGSEKASFAATDFGLFRSDLAETLELARHGWDVEARRAAASELIGWRSNSGPKMGRQHELRLFCDVARLIDAVAQHSRHDAAQMPRFLETVDRLSSRFEELLRTPPSFSGAASIAREPELMRFVSASLEDLLGWWFESHALKAALAGLALQNTGLGPRHEGTGWLLLYQLSGTREGLLRPALLEKSGESGQFIGALAAAARSAGAVIHNRLGAKAIKTRSSRQRGVVLDDGSVVESPWVISTLDAPATLLGLVGAPHLPVRSVRILRRLRMEGSTVRLLGVGGGDQETGRSVIASDLDEMQRAQDWAKRGKASVNPWLISANGSANAHYLPHSVCDDRGAVVEFQKTVRRTLERAWGTSTDDSSGEQWLSPQDWRAHVGATDGAETGGWMTLDQSLVLRPLSGYSGTATPIKGLLLGGAAAHPGGGVTGLPGAAAATAALGRIERQE